MRWHDAPPSTSARSISFIFPSASPARGVAFAAYQRLHDVLCGESTLLAGEMHEGRGR
jgi:hypothetical protein